jgi:hypothetical protein
MRIKKIWIFALLIVAPSWASAQPEGLALSLGGVASKAYTSIPLKPNGGFGITSTLEYGFSDWFSAGIDGGLVEYISPTGQADMKSAWVDLTGRFFPFTASGLGQPYWQVGFGFSPFVKGLFEDYWPDYVSHQLNGSVPSNAIYWNAQTSIGYRFFLSRNWALDTDVQYNLFWPPVTPRLQTLGVETRLVLFLGK